MAINSLFFDNTNPNFNISTEINRLNKVNSGEILYQCNINSNTEKFQVLLFLSGIKYKVVIEKNAVKYIKL